MYSCLVALPFIGAIVCAARGRSLGFHGAGIITTFCIGVSAALSWIALYEVILCRSPVLITVLEWLPLAADGLSISWSFQFDDLSVIMTTVVLTISLLVHIYSIDYIAGDPHGQRFMALLSLFTAFMVLLVTGDSLAILFVGELAYSTIPPRKVTDKFDEVC